jgi:hypothetical protein
MHKNHDMWETHLLLPLFFNTYRNTLAAPTLIIFIPEMLKFSTWKQFWEKKFGKETRDFFWRIFDFSKWNYQNKIIIRHVKVGLAMVILLDWYPQGFQYLILFLLMYRCRRVPKSWAMLDSLLGRLGHWPLTRKCWQEMLQAQNRTLESP